MHPSEVLNPVAAPTPEVTERYCIQDMHWAKDVCNSYMLLVEHQERLAEYVRLYQKTFGVLEKPKGCWTKEEKEYIKESSTWIQQCSKRVLRAGTHCGAQYDKAYELTLLAGKKLKESTKPVDAQYRALKRASNYIINDPDCDGAQREAADALGFTFPTKPKVVVVSYEPCLCTGAAAAHPPPKKRKVSGTSQRASELHAIDGLRSLCYVASAKGAA